LATRWGWGDLSKKRNQGTGNGFRPVEEKGGLTLLGKLNEGKKKIDYRLREARLMVRSAEEQGRKEKTGNIASSLRRTRSR